MLRGTKLVGRSKIGGREPAASGQWRLCVAIAILVEQMPGPPQSRPARAAERATTRGNGIMPEFHLDWNAIAIHIGDWVQGKPLIDGARWCRAKIDRARRQHAAVARIEALQGLVEYDWQAVPWKFMAWERDGRLSYDYKESPYRRLLWFRKEPHSPAPKWLADIFGPDLFADLATVNLGNRLLDDGDCAVFEALPKLSFIDLEDTKISDAGLAHLTDLRDLILLSLDKTQVTDAGLARLKNLPSLESLWLDDTQIGDAGIVNLVGLDLKEIHLDRTQIDDDGVAELVKFKRLRAVHLAGTRITDRGAQLLAALPDLEVLDLSDTGTGNGTLEKLEPLRHLEFLRLTNTRITDDSIKSIAQIGSLKRLDMTNDAIHVSELKQLAVLNHLEALVIDKAVTRKEAHALYDATASDGRPSTLVLALAAGANGDTNGSPGGAGVQSTSLMWELTLMSYQVTKRIGSHPGGAAAGNEPLAGSDPPGARPLAAAPSRAARDLVPAMSRTMELLLAYQVADSSPLAATRAGDALASLTNSDQLFLQTADRYQFRRGYTYEDARRRLGRLNTQRTFDTVVARLKAVGAGERENAVSLLSVFPRHECVPLLVGLLAHDPEPVVRRSAAEGLANRRGERSRAALLDAVADPDWQVAAGAMASLASIEPDKAVGPAVRSIENATDGYVRDAMIGVLNDCHRKAGVEALLKEYERGNKGRGRSVASYFSPFRLHFATACRDHRKAIRSKARQFGTMARLVDACRTAIDRRSEAERRRRRDEKISRRRIW